MRRTSGTVGLSTNVREHGSEDFFDNLNLNEEIEDGGAAWAFGWLTTYTSLIARQPPFKEPRGEDVPLLLA